jgi:hypothetical protein
MDVKRMIGVVLGVVVLALLGTGAVLTEAAAQTDTPSIPEWNQLQAGAPAAAPQKKWHFTLPIGIWPFAIKGPVGVGDYEKDVDLSLSDVQELKDLTVGGAFEAGYDKWTAMVMAVYMRFEPELSTVTVPSVGPVTGSPRLEWFTAELAGAYRAYVLDPGPTMLVIEPLAGVRYTELKASVHVEEPEDVSYGDKSVNWTDGFAGVRVVKSFTKHVGLSFRADAGGGGSNLTWNAGGALGYRFPFETSALTVALGYKASGIDYESSGTYKFMMDQTYAGPTLGVAYSF